jgi:hypothetical protein
MEAEGDVAREGHFVLLQTLRVDEEAVGCVLALAASDDLLFASTQRGLISVRREIQHSAYPFSSPPDT